MEKRSGCKINLVLNVLGRREDGFHELETVLLPVPVHDRLHFEFSTQTDSLTLTCTLPGLPVDDQNLVCRAARAFQQRSGRRMGAAIHLEKQIPVGAGLGGGSANAAATLLAFNEACGRPLGDADLQALAAGLGSDVPFFLQEGAAIGRGRGERLEPAGPLPALAGKKLVLVHPGFGVSTPWAYRNLGRFPDAARGSPGRAQRLVERLKGERLEAAAADFFNALEAPVLAKFPLLRCIQRFFRESGAEVALMSGSGSTTFAFFPREEDTARLRSAFEARFGSTGWWAEAACS